MAEQAIVRTNVASAMIMSQDPERVAARLKLMIVNGKKLTTDEALALAQYSIGTGLNPFLNEAYYIPGVGPGPGIAGWRRKAQEQLEYEAKQANLPAAQAWSDARPATVYEASFDPEKDDIAYYVTIHDSISRTLWEKRVLSHYIELVKAGMKDGAWEISKELAGEEPAWTGVGVVKSSENFGSAEKFDRHERAKKRGEKLALRKRFNLNLPTPVAWDEYDIVEAEVTYADAVTGEIVQPVAIAPPSSLMTLEMANSELGSDGVKYGDKDTKTLSAMANALAKKLKDNGYSPEEREEKQRKLDACRVILADRAGG